MKALRLTLSALLIAVLFSFLASVVLAQSGGGYDLSWSTIDSGGHTFSTGSSYSLGGSIGQPDSSMLTGGSYGLSGGFWGIDNVGPTAVTLQRFAASQPLGFALPALLLLIAVMGLAGWRRRISLR